MNIVSKTVTILFRFRYVAVLLVLVITGFPNVLTDGTPLRCPTLVCYMHNIKMSNVDLLHAHH